MRKRRDMQISIARIRLRAVEHIGLTAGLQSAELIERDGSKIWTEQGNAPGQSPLCSTVKTAPSESARYVAAINVPIPVIGGSPVAMAT